MKSLRTLCLALITCAACAAVAVNPPTASLLSGSYTTNPGITLTADEGCTISYNFGTASGQAPTFRYTGTILFSNYGTYYLTACATDAAGNVSQTVEYTYKYTAIASDNTFFTRVTDASQLIAGAQYLIVYEGESVAMALPGTSGAKRYGADVPVTIVGGQIDLSQSNTSPAVWTLGGEEGAWTLLAEEKRMYLSTLYSAAAESQSSYLTLESSITTSNAKDVKWLITIDDTATITAQRYNLTSTTGSRLILHSHGYGFRNYALSSVGGKGYAMPRLYYRETAGGLTLFSGASGLYHLQSGGAYLAIGADGQPTTTTDPADPGTLFALKQNADGTYDLSAQGQELATNALVAQGTDEYTVATGAGTYITATGTTGTTATEWALTEATSLTRTLHADGTTYYGTAYLPFAYTIVTEGATAYTLTPSETQENTLDATAISGIIPAATGVLLVSTSETVTLNPVYGAETGDVANTLTGTYTTLTPSGDTPVYILSNGSTGVGFYRLANGTPLQANLAYYAPTDAPAATRAFRIALPGTSGLTLPRAHPATAPHAALRDLQGRRVGSPKAPGIYLLPDRKLLVP